MSKYTDAAVERFTSTGWAPLVRDLATELLAARRELAELRKDVARLFGALDDARIALATVMNRARLKSENHNALVDLYARISLALAPAELRPSPVPAAAPESAPNRFREGAQKLADEYASLGIPEHIINAPPQHVTATEMWLAESAPAEKPGDWVPKVGERVQLRDTSLVGDVIQANPLGSFRVEWEAGDGGMVYWPHDLAPAPPPEPVETDDGLTAYQRLCGVTPKQPKPLPQHLADLLAEKCQTYRPGRDWHDDADDYMEARTPQPEPVRDGDFVRATKAERDAHLDAMHDEARRRNMPSSDTYDPSRPTHWLGSGKPPTKPTLDELQRAAAERQAGRLTDKVKHLERKIQAQRAEIHRLRARVKPPKPEPVKGGDFVFASEAERQAHLGEVRAAHDFMHKRGGLDETMRGLPEPVTFTAQGMALDEERAKSWPKRPTEDEFLDAIAEAIRKQPEPPAEGAGEKPRCAMCGQVAHGLHPSAQMDPHPRGPLPLPLDETGKAEAIRKIADDARAKGFDVYGHAGAIMVDTSHAAALRKIATRSRQESIRTIALDALLGDGGGR